MSEYGERSLPDYFAVFSAGYFGDCGVAWLAALPYLLARKLMPASIFLLIPA